MTTIAVKTKATKYVTYLKAECGVRYWEDASVNGVDETDDAPTIPCRAGDAWAPLIHLETGSIVDWPEGTTASTHYKVADDGRYALLDADRNEVVAIEGYVPKVMCPGGDGFGDYVIMDIGPDGKIARWQVDLSPFTDGDEDDGA